jgi:hypothetical protein
MRKARRTCTYTSISNGPGHHARKNLHVGLLHTNQTNGKTLKHTTGKVTNITLGNLAQLWVNISEILQCIEVGNVTHRERP